MFKGKSGGGAGGQGNAPRNLLLETSFHFRPGKDDIEGIVDLECSPSVVSPFSSLVNCGSSLSQTAPLQSNSSATQPSSSSNGSNQLDKEESKAISSEDAQTSPTQIVAAECSSTSSGTCGSSKSQSSTGGGGQQENDGYPAPPPLPSTPQHNAVKGLVSRFRKQIPREQKPKEAGQSSNEKSRRESSVSQCSDAAKGNQGKTKEAKEKEIGLREPLRDGVRDRDSRSPSPGNEVRSSDASKSSSNNKEMKDKESTAISEVQRDGSWFGGIKGKIVKRFEETRARSQSMSAVAKLGQSDGIPVGDAEMVATLGSPGQSINLEEVERAEEADPERMALEQGFGDTVLASDKTNEVTEDDSWEKVELPFGQNEDIQQKAFYKDFAVVKARWIALDSAYIAARFPDVIRELRVLLTQTATIVIPLFIAFALLPLPPFVKGFLVASMAWWTIWKLATALHPPAPVMNGPLTRDTEISPPPLLMPRVPEASVREGWLNALPAGETYNVRTHQGSHSHSVHVRLVGTTLRIRTPKEKLPRRAMWDERRKDINSVVWLGKQWFVELEGANVRLQPEGLSATRLWNKKYPIVVSTLTRPGDEAKEVVLFARTCRDKEYWFRLLKRTAEQTAMNVIAAQTMKTGKDSPVSANDEGAEKSTAEEEEEGVAPRQTRVDFNVYMNNLGLAHTSGSSASPGATVLGVGTSDERRQQLSSQSCCPPLSLAFRDADTQWVNVVLGRLLFDFFMKPRWAEAVRAKFQKKLSKIKVPFFMEELTITDIDLGSCTPLIRRTSAAVHDPETGVWLDLEVAYNGCFQVTVLTKLNLMKLKKGSLIVEENREQEMQEMAPGENRSFDDEIPSEDDDDDASEGTNSQTGTAELEEAQGATSKKILDMVDRISNWSVFQQATDYAFIRKKMEELSNTDLKLTIRLTSLVGRIAINIPPPPTDRLWYGFRSVPRLEFKAIPQMGEREVSFRVKLAAIIEKALFQEFQRVLVMPNMDDLQLDIMEAQPL